MKNVNLNIIYQDIWSINKLCKEETIEAFLKNTFQEEIDIDQNKINHLYQIKTTKKTCFILLDSKYQLLTPQDKVPNKLLIIYINVYSLLEAESEYPNQNEIEILNNYIQNMIPEIIMPKKEEHKIIPKKTIMKEAILKLIQPAIPKPIKKVEKKKKIKKEVEKKIENKITIIKPIPKETVLKKPKPNKIEIMNENKKKQEKTVIKEIKPIKQEIKIEKRKPEQEKKIIIRIKPEMKKKTIIKREEKPKKIEIELKQKENLLKKNPIKKEIKKPIIKKETNLLEKKQIIKEETKAEKKPKQEIIKKVEEKPTKIHMIVAVKKDTNQIITLFNNKEKRKEEPKEKKEIILPIKEEKKERKEEKKTESILDSASTGSEEIKTEQNNNQKNEGKTNQEQKENKKDNYKQRENQEIKFSIILPNNEVIYQQSITNYMPMTVEELLMQTGLTINNTDGLIKSIEGIENKDMSGWVFEVNQAPVMIPASEYIINPNEQITWRYIDFSKENIKEEPIIKKVEKQKILKPKIAERKPVNENRRRNI